MSTDTFPKQIIKLVENKKEFGKARKKMVWFYLVLPDVVLCLSSCIPRLESTIFHVQNSNSECYTSSGPFNNLLSHNNYNYNY
jgi:hypothetical protein